MQPLMFSGVFYLRQLSAYLEALKGTLSFLLSINKLHGCISKRSGHGRLPSERLYFLANFEQTSN